jgi:hypothetical protein
MNYARFSIILTGLCCLGLSAPISPEARTAAEELLTLTNVETNLGVVREQVKASIAAQLRSIDIPQNMQARLSRYQQEVMDTIFDDLSFANMKSAYVDIYAGTFSVDELKQLVAFFKTPAGHAYMEKMPVLLKQTNDVAQARLQALWPRLRKLHEDFLTDLKNASAAH